MLNPYQTIRRPTRTVWVGRVPIGSLHPVQIQSMTTSNTRDAEATALQIMRLADSGCAIARVTVQGMKEAESCEKIKEILLQKGYEIPLVADIHFFPPAALRVVGCVDKVRINPGNYVDKRASFKTISYDDASYQSELDKIEEKFTPLIEKCQKFKCALRIGVNHGSLSDRIMNRYGDTPRGMLESALEFARICRKNNYHDFLFSMKSSNPQVMIHAYRLLAAEMDALGWDYPLHLGVTEAGEGEDGRVKSAMGIGSLLLDGIGDTIRVSLTEDPWYEIDPCQRLIAFAKYYEEQKPFYSFTERHRSIEREKRSSTFPKNIGLHRDGTVIVSATTPVNYEELGCKMDPGGAKLTKMSADGVFVLNPHGAKELDALGIQVFSKETFQDSQIVQVNEEVTAWKNLREQNPKLLFFSPRSNHFHSARAFFDFLKREKITAPVILHFQYDCSREDLIIHAACEIGALFCDGLGDGVWIEAPHPIHFLRELSFSILQAARMRSSKTEFISCPSCGRTLFDLQDVSKRIRERTSHLPGVKIAIMGCIVNGPGEMADADFGYVGSKPGMIDLYVGKTCVEKSIPFELADQKLIDLIKTHGKWVDPY